MSTLLIAVIQAYQQTLSPDHSWLKARFPYGYCQFYPSCSSYAIEAIGSHGSLRGSLLALRRLLRCHPWSRGGVDHVPTR